MPLPAMAEAIAGWVAEGESASFYDVGESVITARTGERITRAFSSEAIAFIDYEIDTQELSVTFTRGGPYVYTGVPQSVVEGWLTADSAGRYYHAFIKHYG